MSLNLFRGTSFLPLLGSLLLSLTSAEAEPKKYRLAIVVPDGSSYFWQATHAGAIKAQREFSKNQVEVQLLWSAPHDPNNLPEQINLVGDAVGSGIDALALAPLDPHALVPPVELASRQKIPVVNLELPLDYPLLTSTVATSNYRCGLEAAIMTGKLLQERGTVLVLRHTSTQTIEVKRENGFMEGVSKYYEAMKVLAPEEYVGTTEEDAYHLTQKFLKQYGGQISALYTSTVETTKGAHRALVESGLNDHIKQVGFLLGQEALTAIKNGDLQGVIAPDPFGLGYLTVKALLGSAQGRIINPRIEVPNATITADNLQDPNNQKNLAPNLEEFLGQPPVPSPLKTSQ